MYSRTNKDFDSIDQVQSRVSHTLENNGLLMDLSIEHCKRYLQRKVNSKTKVVVMYVDINGSTKMSRDLSSSQLSLIIQIFSQETSLSITNYRGYILKFVGDAVIGLFPSEHSPSKALENSFACAINVLNVISNGINPIFKKNSLPAINVKIGIEYGDAIILVYGKNTEFAHIDLIGFSISIASKITSLASQNEIIVGENAYNLVDADQKKYFIELTLNEVSKWDNIMKYNNDFKFRIYRYLKR
ncbi:MAG TPA: adenylate/guanylate cyclase domain-containing protein [Candidatus Nitrosocosmicus sp.]